MMMIKSLQIIKRCIIDDNAYNKIVHATLPPMHTVKKCEDSLSLNRHRESDFVLYHVEKNHFSSTFITTIQCSQRDRTY